MPDFRLIRMLDLLKPVSVRWFLSCHWLKLEKDPLMVFAEPYNTLILDGKGFKSPIPGC